MGRYCFADISKNLLVHYDTIVRISTYILHYRSNIRHISQLAYYCGGFSLTCLYIGCILDVYWYTDIVIHYRLAYIGPILKKWSQFIIIRPIYSQYTGSVLCHKLNNFSVYWSNIELILKFAKCLCHHN